MAEFLTTTGCSFYIEKIIIDAKESLTLVTPYLSLSKNLIDRLTDAENRGVKIILIYGKNSLKHQEQQKLDRIENIAIYFCENLHAKCYFNEQLMVITSMNLYEFSEKNNREMGVLVRRESDQSMFEDCVKETESIKNSSVIEKEVKAKKARYSYFVKPKEEKEGFWESYSKKFYEGIKDKIGSRSKYIKHEYDGSSTCDIEDYPFSDINWCINRGMRVSFKDKKHVLYSREYRPAIRAKFPEFKITWKYSSIDISFLETSIALENMVELSYLLFNHINDILLQSLAHHTETSKSLPNLTGYCIRCETGIDFSPEKPYCYDCYKSWVQYENYGYIEKYCHGCGKKHKTSMDYPQCGDCYSGKKDSSLKEFKFQESDKALIYFENGEYSFRQSVPHSMYRILANKFGTERIFEIHQNAFKHSFAFSMNHYPIKDITWNFHENAYLTIEFEDLKELNDFETFSPEILSMFPDYSMNWGKYQINIRRTLGDIDRTEELLHEVVQTQLEIFEQFSKMLASRIQRPL